MPKKKRGDEKIYRYGKVYKYDNKGNFISEFDSYQACWQLEKITPGHLWDILNDGKTKRIKGHIYTYDFYLKFPVNEKLLDGRKKSKQKIKIYQYDLNGKFIKEWESITDAAKALNLNRCHISSVSKLNFKRQAGGFLWSRILINNIQKFEKKSHRTKKIKQFSLNGKLIKIYESLTEAEKYTGINKFTISHCARGKQKTSGGFIWKYDK